MIEDSDEMVDKLAERKEEMVRMSVGDFDAIKNPNDICTYMTMVTASSPSNPSHDSAPEVSEESDACSGISQSQADVIKIFSNIIPVGDQGGRPS